MRRNKNSDRVIGRDRQVGSSTQSEDIKMKDLKEQINSKQHARY